MEMCDVVDELGARTGRTVARGTRLAPGEFYLVVHVWIRDEAGKYLIQQRAPDLSLDPGIWATTVGYVQAGEDSLAGAIREVNEELGLWLMPAQLRRLERLKTENRIEDLWLADVSPHLREAPRMGSEVSNWKWVSKAEIEEMIGRGDFYAYSYFSSLPG